MRELYSDEYASLPDAETNRTIPASIRRAASAAVFVGLVGALGIWGYRLGTRDATEVPIIRAMQGPTRVAPDAPGGLQAAHKGHEINGVLEGASVPAPRHSTLRDVLPALAEEDGPQAELKLAAAPAPDEAATPDEAGRPRGMTPQEMAQLLVGGAARAPEDDGLVAPAPSMGGEPAARPGADGADILGAKEEPEPQVAAGPRPVSRPSNLVRIRVAAKAPDPAPEPKRAAPAPAPAAPQIREVSRVTSGSRLVQLGAYDSEEITRQAWRRLVAANGDLLGAKSLYVERATNNARVFYRLRVAGFENTDQTRVLCEALRARSIDCIPVTLQ